MLFLSSAEFHENQETIKMISCHFLLGTYRIERKFGMFSKLDACTFVANVYDDGNILSIVTDSSPHGTHVAGIATAFHPEVLSLW